MTSNKFFTGKGIGFLILIILGLVFFIFKTYLYNTNNKEVRPLAQNTNNTEVMFFEWKYEKATSLNLDGNPETNIFLEVGYSDGTMQGRLIDTVPMGCNDLPDSKEIVAPNSYVAQCYGAGLGYWYKVTQGENSYLVERKKFEEAIPDYEPPVYQYEIISEFSFTS